jgi:hypothetical protein
MLPVTVTTDDWCPKHFSQGVLLPNRFVIAWRRKIISAIFKPRHLVGMKALFKIIT